MLPDHKHRHPFRTSTLHQHPCQPEGTRRGQEGRGLALHARLPNRYRPQHTRSAYPRLHGVVDFLICTQFFIHLYNTNFLCNTMYCNHVAQGCFRESAFSKVGDGSCMQNRQHAKEMSRFISDTPMCATACLADANCTGYELDQKTTGPFPQYKCTWQIAQI